MSVTMWLLLAVACIFLMVGLVYWSFIKSPSTPRRRAEASVFGRLYAEYPSFTSEVVDIKWMEDSGVLDVYLEGSVVTTKGMNFELRKVKAQHDGERFILWDVKPLMGFDENIVLDKPIE
jgi:hypothetical protein